MKPVAANGTARVALRDIVLGGGKYRIPANTGLWMPTFSIQNSELNWGPDADVYRPVSRAAASDVYKCRSMIGRDQHDALRLIHAVASTQVVDVG